MFDLAQFAERLSRPLPRRPLVSVVMTLFNSEATLASSVRSLLEQTHRHLEVVLSDDGSTDGTIELARRLCAEDHRVRLVSFGGNHGTYWAKNFGILNCRGEVVTFADSDDMSDDTRIEQQLEALRKPGVVVSTCSYRRVDDLGNALPIPGSRGFAFITQMMRREVFDVVGFFDSVRTSADDEMLQRIRLVFGSQAHENVPVHLYTALVREGSLSHNRDNPRYSEVTRGLSPARQAYAAGFRGWHRAVAAGGGLPYIPFPVVNRPFPVDPKLEVHAGRHTNDDLTVVAYGTGRDCAVERLEFLCRRMIACEYGSDRGMAAADGKLKILRVASRPAPEALAEMIGDRATGYVVVCDLDASLPPDFVQRALLSVESAPQRIGPSAAVDSSGNVAGNAGVVAYHAEGREPTSSGRNFLQEWSPDVPPSEAHHPGAVYHARRRAESRSSVHGTGPQPGAGAPAGPVPKAGSARVAHHFTGLVRKFLVLWAKSELLLAAWLLMFVVAAMTALIAGTSGLFLFAVLGLIVGISAGILMIARRTRLIANPMAGAEGQKRVAEFAAALRTLKTVVRRRGMPLG